MQLSNDTRQQQLYTWLQGTPFPPQGPLVSVSGDASFRRYFRYEHAGTWLVAVDAPPPQESLQPFMAITARYREAGLLTPQVHAHDAEQGFMLLTDFGDTLLYHELKSDARAETLYQQALGLLPAIMRCEQTELGALPDYDQALLLREMDLFSDWLLSKEWQLNLTASQQACWQGARQILLENALNQPQRGVHRDYHSRNIMLTENKLALIDFQDAVKGPITYDAVSLLRDCYLQWPLAMVERLRDFLYQRLRTEGLLDATISSATFARWFDLMGVQRHLKAAGIFARLKQRDGKPGYMADVPRTLGYVVAVCAQYEELQDFAELVASLRDEAMQTGASSCVP